jgi:hypothetical protein
MLGMSADQLAIAVGLVRDGGTILLLTVAIVGGIRGWYVWRREYDRVVNQLQETIADRDAWRAIAGEKRQ